MKVLVRNEEKNFAGLFQNVETACASPEYITVICTAKNGEADYHYFQINDGSRWEWFVY